MSMAAATMILAGCSNDENTAIDNSPVELRLTSGVTVQQTRATFTPTQSTSIKEGEKVSVWVNQADNDGTELYKANQLTANSDNSFTGKAMYFPQNGFSQVNIYAIHGNFTTPFSEGTAFPTTAVEYSVEADQSKAGGTHYTNSDLLYAYETEVKRNGNPTTQKLTFYHMLSKLEVAIQIGEGSPKLASSDAVTLGGVKLNGKFTPPTEATMSDLSARADMLTDADEPNTGNMILGQTECTGFDENNVFYNEAIIVPQEMKDKVLTFKLEEKGELKYKIPEFDNTPGYALFKSGKKYIYHITLDLTGLTVTSQIKDWEPVKAVDGTAEMEPEP